MHSQKSLFLVQPNAQACTLTAVARRAGYRIAIAPHWRSLPWQEHQDNSVLVLLSCRAAFPFDNGIPPQAAELLAQTPDVAEARVALYQAPKNSVNERVALMMGLQGIYYDHHSLERLLVGLSKMLAGELWFSSHVVGELCQQLIKEQGSIEVGPQSLEKVQALTNKEVRVLMMIHQGARNKEIARSLYISEHTVKSHISALYRKIDARSRIDLHEWASRHKRLLAEAS
ncbi:helix-turn-helix transcriptional regulator [Paraferrimonas sedimenticola]|uniref:Helix-turn-helix transcriptional regulator n=1 Tax=Paraferrimonas sedimenticola TaxID=375674 RepID=A0AA37RVQ9_9GAMM|nr:response regulator transcription factor [Paraferrimonas sedimenticola]GLP95527.1 helix-turn-helix transcriptional regulator [Paraferrimonas sedimenticola]